MGKDVCVLHFRLKEGLKGGQKETNMWSEVFLPPDPGQVLDLARPFVAIGPYTVQHLTVYGVPEGTPQEDVVALLEAVPGVSLHVEHTGARTGYGHGRETVRLVNADGSLIYEMTRVDYCAGSGYSCSYSHGPWVEYGAYNGDAEPDPDIALALQALSSLRAKLRW